MTVSNVEKYLEEAKTQFAPHEIIDQLLKVVGELNREVKRITRNLHRVRSEIQKEQRKLFQ